MATNSRELDSNRISGRIVLKETGVGIPDLLVVIYDLDPGTRSEEGFEAPASPSSTVAPTPPAFLGDRLGSVLSGADGSWALGYQDAEFRILNNTEKRPDLQLMVLAPEDADAEAPPTVLFSSKLMRMNSGRLEAYLIRISAAQLEAVKVPIPADTRPWDEGGVNFRADPCFFRTNFRPAVMRVVLGTLRGVPPVFKAADSNAGRFQWAGPETGVVTQTYIHRACWARRERCADLASSNAEFT